MDRVGYQSLITSYQQQEIESGNEDNPPSDHNLMVHVVPEHNKSKNHIFNVMPNNILFNT